MSMRCLQSLRTFHLKKNTFFPYMNTNFTSQSPLLTSSNNIQTAVSKRIEITPAPKHVQPLVNDSVEEVFSCLNSKLITETESVSLLKTLRMLILFKNMNSDNFKNDQRFQTLCNIFEKNCNGMNPNLLVSGLRSLLEVGVSPDSKCVITAEESILNNIYLFSTFNIIGCLYFHHKFTETDLQKKVVSILTNELCKRIEAITSNAAVLMLVQFLHIFNEDDQKRIQQRVTELIRALNAHEICKIFNILAENSNRNISILNALAFHLQEKVEVLQIKEILDILYSFKKLNFIDVHLISNLMNAVVRDIPSLKQPSIISGILTICGHLRFRHTGVLNTCAEWIVSNVEICRPKEFISFILTVASLNYQSLEIQKALHAMLPLITFEKVESLNVWLDYVWSLAILNNTDKEMLLKVLSPDFYKSLIDDSGFQVATNKLKLMNLKAVLKSCYPECIFGCNLFLDPFEITQSIEIQNSRKHVIKALSNFVLKEKYLITNQNTDMGILIDAEFIMDKNMRPLSLREFGILSKVTNTKPLPKGAQRLALLVLFYKDITLCSPSRSGISDLAIRLLFSLGYTAVPIPFAEFMKNKTEVNKAKYLLQKITRIMERVEENGYKFHINLFN